MVRGIQITTGAAMAKLSELGLKASLLFMDGVITKEEFDTIEKIIGDAKERIMKEFLEV